MAEMSLGGIDELLAKLQRMSQNTSGIENKAIRAGGEVIRKAISKRAPRSDKIKRHLGDNITMSQVKTQDGTVKFVEIGPQKGDNSEFFYGKFLEWGTSKMPAQPFMEPGANEAKNDAIEATKNVLREAIGE